MTYSFDIGHLSRAYAQGGLSPTDVIEDVYRRIAAEGERPVFISLLPLEDALAKASRAPEGPLHGIPFAVKDNIDVAGLPTTCACPEFAYQPGQSARVVELLEAAGAVAIGKTNMDQFATGLNGTRSPYGIPASPFDADYISGGSSSGSAVAVAKGLVSFALGTDTAGSGRVPAAFNNIVGLKPTKGIISSHGVVPACRTQDTVSIFALTVSDAHRVLDTAAIFDPQDPFARPAARGIPPEWPLQHFRLGVPKATLEFFGNGETRELYRAAIERAQSIGATIVEIDFAPFAETAELLYAGPWVAERFAALAPFLKSHADTLHPAVREIILNAAEISAVDAFKGMYRLAELIRAAEAEWANMDGMILPTAPETFRIADMLADPVRLNSRLGRFTNFVNLMDLSALAVPAGFGASGLPSGVTLIARAHQDALLAVLGDAIHREAKGTMLGATQISLGTTSEFVPRPHATIQVAVVGAHLTGQPLNGQLVERKARLVRTARTAPGYSFYALANTTPAKPGLVFDRRGAGLIEVEVWELSEAAFGSFVALIPPPLGIGTIQLSDGSHVKGFLCESHAVHDAEDITALGGWRAWLSGRSPGRTPT